MVIVLVMCISFDEYSKVNNDKRVMVATYDDFNDGDDDCGNNDNLIDDTDSQSSSCL